MNRIWTLAALSLVLGCGLLADLSGTRCNPDGSCGDGLVCLEGRCETSCGERSDCGGRCADLQSEPSNCGRCGLTCSEGEACAAGLCVPASTEDAGVVDAGADDAGSADSGTEELDPGGPKPICGTAGWCWDQPSPQAEDLQGVFAFGADHLWAFGRVNLAMRWNGKYWTGHPVPFGGLDVHAMHGLRPDDVWAVGMLGRAAHWNGTGWKPENLPDRNEPAHAVWVIAANHVLAVGGNGTSWVWNGIEWAETSTSPGSATYRALWGDGQGSVYAVGSGGAIARYAYDPSAPGDVSSGQWQLENSGTGMDLFAVTGAQGLVYAGGTTGTLRSRGAGGTWGAVAVTSAIESAVIRALDLDADGTLWIGTESGFVARKLVGGSMGAVRLRATGNASVTGLAGFDGVRAVAVGPDGLVAWHGPVDGGGTRWVTEVPGEGAELVGITANARGVWALARAGGVLTREANGEWASVDSLTFDVEAIASDPQGDVLWVVGKSGIAYSDDRVTFVDLVISPTHHYYGVSSPAPGVAYVVGDSGDLANPGLILKCDLLPSPNCAEVTTGLAKVESLRAAWASSNQLQWFVGAMGEAVRCEAGTCDQPLKNFADAPAELLAVWGIDNKQVWLGGRTDTGYGVVVRWNGSGMVRSPTLLAPITGIAGAGSVIWAVGVNGLWATISGDSVTEADAMVHYTLHDVAAAGGTFWAAGGRQTVLRRGP